ncbi:hypothetical protein CRYUN_Cryun15aG0047000 [Craigia yunnanensis]
MDKEDGRNNLSCVMPRGKYPKPLIFHDGRLAFLPTPFAALSMFLWLPFGIVLAIFRILVGICLPYKLAIFWVFLSTALCKPLTAVTYSLSKMSEVIAPIKTVRLTRDRKQNGETMQKLPSEGDLVVCPEGTTCREPYLLTFSSLFAELAYEIVLVAMNAHVSMFYGTTASGLKWLDPIFFLMNPRPSYHVQILGKMPQEFTCAGGRSGFEVANYIQRKLADARGFECTTLTRRDKYLMLAGNDGVVHENKRY